MAYLVLNHTLIMAVSHTSSHLVNVGHHFIRCETVLQRKGGHMESLELRKYVNPMQCMVLI